MGGGLLEKVRCGAARRGVAAGQLAAVRPAVTAGLAMLAASALLMHFSEPSYTTPCQ